VKRISFVSGKGGTGKSTLVASLSLLVKDKMLADCDVDAPNLHILINNEVLSSDDYYGAKEAVINPEICAKCGRCKVVCRFDAINDACEIDPMHCEGCGACIVVCPVRAIRLEPVKTGRIYVARTERGTFAHALLDIGAEGSGKLVTEVRKKLEQYKKDEKWVLIDGSPGIGCVVIASITGADAVVAVAEPTKSGLSDLERVLGVTRYFGIPGLVCINKFDLNPEITAEIESFCREEGFPVIGRISYDPAVMKALQGFKTPVEAGNTSFTSEIELLWEEIKKKVGCESKTGSS
jgi:MinD superfamily P-loop ATPase